MNIWEFFQPRNKKLTSYSFIVESKTDETDYYIINRNAETEDEAIENVKNSVTIKHGYVLKIMTEFGYREI